MTADLAIRAEGLVRRFPTRTGETIAVDGVDLAVAPGEVYGFLGPNGAGKTTTVRMLVTLLSPSDGDAWVLGCSVRDEPERVRLSIGAALQEAALDAKQTGEEILRLQGRLYGLTRREVDRRVHELAELVDIGDALSRPVGTYSGGMRRRLDLAAALVHRPSVLFLDEPTTGLDPVSRQAVWEEVGRLNEQLGMTVFLTTQYLEEADRLADRVGIIAAGGIAAEGTPAVLKRQVGDDLVVVRVGSTPDRPLDGRLPDVLDRLRALEAVDRVDAGRETTRETGNETGSETGSDDPVEGVEVTVATPDGARVVGRVALALEEAGVAVEQLTLRTPTLDDVFLRITGSRLRAGAGTGTGNRGTGKEWS